MKLAYREFGAGKPLIILHGLFGQSDNWNTLAKNFAEKGFHVFTLDQRNHGLSPHSELWNYEVMADDVFEFIQDHNLKEPVLLGHSMGAKTVLFFENKYPRIASKLIIADMAARAYPAHHQTVLAALHAVNFDEVKTRKEAEAVMNTHLDDFGTKQFLLKNIYWKENERMDWRFNLEVISRLYDEIRVAAPMFKSAVKTLIITGANSNYVTEEDQKDFQNRFTNIEMISIAGAGHWVHAEKPKEFFEAVLNFLSN